MGSSDNWIVFVVAWLISVVFVLALSIPILALLISVRGVVVRFRINYTPKGVGLGEQGDEQTLSQDMRVGPFVNSVWGMFVRVKKIEGIQGFVKGLMPLLLLVFPYAASLAIIGGQSARLGIDAGGPISTVFWPLFIAFISIPGEILVNRAITTPHKLGWFSPRVALRALFTPYERSKPWVLFLTPGLALAQSLHVLYFLAITRGLRALLVPSYHPNEFFKEEPLSEFGGFWEYAGMGLYLVFLIGSFAILTPLEVLSARLSVQRNHPTGASVLPTSTREGREAMLNDEGSPGLEYAGAEEDVIALRDEDAPYSGLLYAYRKVIEEEGRGTLYRCWWLTLWTTFGPGFA